MTLDHAMTYINIKEDQIKNSFSDLLPKKRIIKKAV